MSSRGYGDKATGEDASLGKRLSEAALDGELGVCGLVAEVGGGSRRHGFRF